jgi:hypothetical protein
MQSNRKTSIDRHSHVFKENERIALGFGGVASSVHPSVPPSKRTPC